MFLFLVIIFYPKINIKIKYEYSKFFNQKNTLDSLKFYDASNFDFIGKLPNTDKYRRLPDSAEKLVRSAIWELSKRTAGISIRFSTNSSSISIRWKLIFNRHAPYITSIASKGLDLYVYNDNKWRFIGIAKPNGSLNNMDLVIDGMEPVKREYLLNLPLYDGIESLEIGIDNDAFIKKSENLIINRSMPIIIYGTSITQGASASRPGLTYSALLQRFFNIEVINLGFSGNGRFEKELGYFFMKSDPSIIILDCTANSDPDTIMKNLPELINYIRSINKVTPIYIIEGIHRDFSIFKLGGKYTRNTIGYIDEQNRILSKIFNKYTKTDNHIYLIKGNEIIGTDNEATIDGTHFNDLGNYRAFEYLKNEMAKIYR